MAIRSLSIVAILLAGGQFAGAAPVPIVNAGFEAPYLGGNLPPQYNGDVPPTAFPTGAAPSGWQAYGAVGGNAFIGVLNPGVMANEPLAAYFPAGAYEGDNVALAFYDGHLGGGEFGISQTLATTLSADTLYTLTVAVGNIASGTSAVQPYASFGFGDAHPQLGQPLGIRLVNRNQLDVIDPVVDLEVDFDAIALDASPFDPTELVGDYSNNGTVDSADYVRWRQFANHESTPTERLDWGNDRSRPIQSMAKPFRRLG
jgi:hypothetical protein